jgi:hypothetical protein
MERQGRASPLLRSRPRKSGLPDLRTFKCETRASPGFLAGRVDRVSGANAGGVGGLHVLRPCGEANNACSVLAAPPTPNPFPPRAARAGGGERRRSA